MGPGEVGEAEGGLGEGSEGSGGTAGSVWSLVWASAEGKKAPMELVLTLPEET